VKGKNMGEIGGNEGPVGQMKSRFGNGLVVRDIGGNTIPLISQ